jgi:hypothetical protein
LKVKTSEAAAPSTKATVGRLELTSVVGEACRISDNGRGFSSIGVL